VVTRTVRRWLQDAEETLQGCFEMADWDVLCNGHGQDIDRFTGCITDYVNFCTDLCDPDQGCALLPQQLGDKDIKASLNRKDSGVETRRR